MFQKLKDFIDHLEESEKDYFDNGFAVEFDWAGGATIPIWSYGIFVPNTSKSIMVYKWHRLLPPELKSSESVELNPENTNSAVAEELLKLIENEEISPIINAT